MYQRSFVVSGLLSEKELANLKLTCNEFRPKAKKAGIYSGGKGSVNETFRKSMTYFPTPEEFKYGFNLLQSLIISDYYSVYPDLNYDRISEIQYSMYENGGKFKKHQDVVAVNKETVRCLTMSINLSDESEYEGGELVIFVGKEEVVLNRKAGSYVIFPSFYMHEAREVKSGKREAIVTWLHSPIDKLNKFKKNVQQQSTTKGTR